MCSDWFSDEPPEDDLAPPNQQAANAERDALRRAQMVIRARERADFWRRQLAAERFDEFKPEMRRRVAVEQALLDGLEKTDTPSFVLMRTYLAQAVHKPSQPRTEAEEECDDLQERIGKATQRRKDLLGTLQLTPQRQGWERKELLRKIASEEEYVRGLQAKVRALRA